MLVKNGIVGGKVVDFGEDFSNVEICLAPII
jgi:hypothetical protein